MQYFVKRTKTRGYRLIERTGRGTPQDTQTVIEDEMLAGINRQLELGIIPPSEAHKKALAVARRYRDAARGPDPLKSITDANLELVEEYTEKVLNHKDNRVPYYAKQRLLRAVAALRGRDLLTMEAHEITACLNANIDNLTTRRDAVAAIRQLLKFGGKPNLYIGKPRKDRPPTKYLTLDQFRRVVAQVDGEIERLVLWVGFATGGRLGEVFALEKMLDDGRGVRIDRQMDEGRAYQKTKTRGQRWAFVVPEGRDAVRAWIATPEKERYRLWKWAQITAAACVKAGVPEIRYHDLRHSYAVYLLQQGNTIEKVAKFLGNYITVCQEYYAGLDSDVPELDGVKIG